ncbi:isochorismatase [Coleofasciculus chthonoplastes]|uniref:isochorismatase n=1 Tax=Coleofasciculus chthonoplastes TaxID=64178 RepID=UPI0033026C2B
MSNNTQLPIPSHFNSNHVGDVWRVPYQERVNQAEAWAKQHHLQPAHEDETRIGLLLIDVQNTFCIPEFELFVGGQSGTGAVDDNVRLCEFIYRNLGVITEIAATMDTHTAMQIFHPIFWINDAGEHPPAMANISMEDVEKGVWKINPAVVPRIRHGDEKWLQDYALHYAKTLNCDSKYPLIIWPYHAMLGGISHALVSAVEEACLFHNVARQSQTHFEMKGSNPVTENYSVLQPEVLFDQNDQPIAQNNTPFLAKLLEFDRLIIAGQAKSHCVAWTVDNLLGEIQARDAKLAEKVYLLDDCTSPVVVPGGADFTEQADAAFQRFADAGMHCVKSTELID